MTSSYASTATLSISSFESDKNICEAHGCDNLATTEIEVEAGKYGTIHLNLCIDCVPLFEANQDKNRKLSNKPKHKIAELEATPVRKKDHEKEVQAAL